MTTTGSMTPENNDKEYDFVLSLQGESEVSDELANALFEAGCDDALLTSSEERVLVYFTREASSFQEAVDSAIRQIESAEGGPFLPVLVEEKEDQD